MTPEEARRYVEVLDLYAGDLEALVEETRADKPGLTSALNPRLRDMAHGVATVREKITADAENMTRMIAGMYEEYAVQVLRAGEWQYSRDEDNFRWQDLAVQMVRTVRDHPDEETRIVRRYVTTPEEA